MWQREERALRPRGQRAREPGVSRGLAVQAALQGFRFSAGGCSRMPEGRFRVIENAAVLLLWRK